VTVVAVVSRRDGRVAKARAISRPTFIGMSRQVSSEQKAIWHNVTGAGKRGVVRRFFDVNEEDTQACAEGLEKLIDLRLKAQGA